MRTVPKRQTATKLAARADCDPRTALRWLDQLPVSHVSRAALERAARELGLVPNAPNSNPPPQGA